MQLKLSPVQDNDPVNMSLGSTAPADDLATQETNISTIIVLPNLSRNIPALAPGGHFLVVTITTCISYQIFVI